MAASLCGDGWEADEIAQETFIIAIRKLPEFRGDASPRTFLIGICLRVHRSRYRAAGRRFKRWLNYAQVQTFSESAATPTAEEAEDLWREVRRLPRTQADAVTLRYGHGMSVSEISDAMGCPEGTTKSRLHHGLNRLRTRLGASNAPDHRTEVATIRSPSISLGGGFNPESNP